MKKIITLFLIICSLQGFAQDTTAVRWVGLDGWSHQLHLFKSDTTALTTVSSPYGTGHAIFMNNADSLVYALMTESETTGDRNLYKVNPFDGSLVLSYDFTTTYFNTGDISEDGLTFYGIEGNAGTLGQITAVDLGTMTETVITTALGTAGNSSYGMEFHPADSSLYIYEGDYGGNQRIQRIDLETLANVNEALIGGNGGQLHGAMWSGIDNVFYVFDGAGQYLKVSDETSNNLTDINNLPNYCFDIDEFYTLRREADVIKLCPNIEDSTLLSSIYPFDAVQWLMDGVEMTETNDSIWVSEPGTYQALFPLLSGDFMWSETVVVEFATVPLVTVIQTEGDNLICEGEFITLTGVSGGTLQWFLNGEIIVDANGSTYDAGEIGLYNQMKTNNSGCSDTADVAYEIFEDPNCGVGINQLDKKVNIFPNPVDNMLTIESTVAIESITIFDITGRMVYQINSLNNKKEIVNLESIDKGSYLINIKTKKGTISKTVVK